MKGVKMKNIFITTILVFILVIQGSGCTAKDTMNADEQKSMEKIVEGFIQGINDQDSNKAKEFISQKVRYTEKYGEASKYTSNKPEEIDQIIQDVMDNHTNMTVTNIEVKNNKTVRVEGTVTDYVIEIIGLTEGIRFSSEYTIKDGKITAIEFERNQDDEALVNEKTEGIVGFYIDFEEDQIIVDGCDEGLPADQAGLKTGDIIEAVDGIPTTEMKYGMNEAIYRIRGVVGTKVELTINRDGTIFTVDIQRVKE